MILAVIFCWQAYTLTCDLLSYLPFHVRPYFDQNSQQILRLGPQDKG